MGHRWAGIVAVDQSQESDLCKTLHCIGPPAPEALPYFEDVLRGVRLEGTFVLPDAPPKMHHCYALDVREACVCAGVEAGSVIVISSSKLVVCEMKRTSTKEGRSGLCGDSFPHSRGRK